MLHAVLKVVGGKQDGKLILLNTKKFLIGREQDCHLRPGSESVAATTVQSRSTITPSVCETWEVRTARVLTASGLSEFMKQIRGTVRLEIRIWKSCSCAKLVSQ